MSLLSHCLDLKFMKPTGMQIMNRVQMICRNENLAIPEQQLRQLIEASGFDLRQIINILQMWKNQKVSMGSKDFVQSITKDEKVMINNYDAAKKLLNHGQNSL